MSAEEIAGIKAAVSEVFGPDAVVRLFGSRVDDARRGGDIDLLVEVPEGRESFNDQIAAKVALWDRIGERKIDLVLMGPGGPTERIHRVALKEGIVLEGDPAILARMQPKGSEPMRADKLADALIACDRIAARLELSLVDLEGELPATPEGVEAFDKARQTDVDAFLKRFEQLEDMALRKVARGALLISVEDSETFTIRDALNALERLGAIGSADQWMGFHEARNRLAHEYDFKPEAVAARLNAAWEAARLLAEDWNTLRGFALKVLAQEGHPQGDRP
ncbi:MAG: nucleotidyltransferase domain-containing protein [Pseudomonadota bacterium]